ncbi:MAG: hypothetical protein PF542_04440 [Nanoarchaeota archaeon]|jgi:predicted alpha/beta hydrolase family esterase|nr:hypothetical protein [Nanoarchaeota archaeon]
MTNVMILHGTGCPPDLYWYTYVKENLENKGYTVSVSNLPNAGEANIEEWLPFVLENTDIDKDTILIGHSSGGPLIFSIL